MSADFNDGRRPSRLELGRRLTGELPADGSPELAAYAREIEAARAAMPPFDFEVLRARAERLDERAPARRPARRSRWAQLLMGLTPALVAAAALLALQVPSEGIRAKGGADLDFFVLQDGEVRPGVDGEVLRAGDRVQFTYRAEGLDTLVIAGVDGGGTVSLYYPERGDEPVAIAPYGRRVLEGSIVLDEAEGPEVFVAVFGADSAEEVLEEVEAICDEEGWRGLLAWAREDPGVDALRVEKEAP